MHAHYIWKYALNIPHLIAKIHHDPYQTDQTPNLADVHYIRLQAVQKAFSFAKTPKNTYVVWR